MRERSVAFSAKSPNATELPRCELPFRLPLNCLRNLVRFGCIMSSFPGSAGRRLGRRALGGLLGRGLCLGGFRLRGLGLERLRLGLLAVEHLALEHPDLDADDAVG